MDTDKTPTLKLGCSCCGVILTAVIILVRAFQPNAIPISDWSWQSWVWMTIPIWLPAIFGIIIFAMFFVLYIWAAVRK